MCGGSTGWLKSTPLAFLIAAGGQKFSRGFNPQSPVKYSPACCPFPKNLPMHSRAQAFRPQTLPFRAVISQSRLTRPPPQTPTELTSLQAVRPRTHARSHRHIDRPTLSHCSQQHRPHRRARAASSHSEIRRQINQCVRVPCFQAHFLRISYEPFRRTNQRLFKFSSPFFSFFFFGYLHTTCV